MALAERDPHEVTLRTFARRWLFVARSATDADWAVDDPPDLAAPEVMLPGEATPGCDEKDLRLRPPVSSPNSTPASAKYVLTKLRVAL